VEELRRAKEDESESISELHKRLAAMKSESEQLQEKLQKDETSSARTENLESAALKARIGDLESELQFLQLANEKSESERADESKKGEEWSAKVNALVSQVQGLQSDLDAANAKLAEATAAAEASAAAAAAAAQESGEGKKAEYPNIQISETKPDADKDMLEELIKQKAALQEENSMLIGELTEAKIELAEYKMANM